MVNYKKLFHVLIEQDMTNAQLRQKAGFSANIMTRIKHNKYVSLESLEQICRVLNCKLDDILEFEPDETYPEQDQLRAADDEKKLRYRFRLHRETE